MAIINVDDAYILNETGAQVDKVTGLFTKDENTTDAEKAFAQLNIGGGGGGRNLLDNPFFTVRQRGNGPFNGAGFTVDRWSISGASSTLTANSGYISLNMAANAVFNQRVAVELELGKPYTASLMERDGTVYSATFTPTASENIFALGPYICVFDARATYAPNYRFYIYKETAWTADLKAVKLELGSVSTLANDTPPDYGTELAKCQYYFRRLYTEASMDALPAMAVTATAADVINWTGGLPMRKANATVTYSGTINVYDGSNHAVTAVGDTVSGSQRRLRFTTTGLTPNTACYIALNGHIDISCDL